MSNIFKKFFDFQILYNGLKFKIKILGIKMTFPTIFSFVAKKSSPFYYYKKHNIDITKIPSATGQLRDVQLANLAILKDFDKFCRSHNLKYWLEYGTLLGAVRHQGYIPWDDDIDVGMPRDDYDRFVEIFEKESPDSNLHLVHAKADSGMYLLKLSHKHSDLLFVDIFPHDYCKKHIDRKDKDETIEKIKQIRSDFIKKINLRTLSTQELNYEYYKLKENITVIEKRDSSKAQDLMYGIEFGGFTRNFVESYDDIFPLKEYKFEGFNFFSVNNFDIKLKELYGDSYMDYPEQLCWGHGGYIKLSNIDKKTIKNLIKSYDNSVVKN